MIAGVHYVCGFLFTPSHDMVALIRKNRPTWQLGRLNGIGGKIEPGETPVQAMQREFREEAGLDFSAWELFHRERFPYTGADVLFYCGADKRAETVKTCTDEQVGIYRASGRTIDEYGVYNLGYLLPMARTYLGARPAMRWTVPSLQGEPA